MHRASIHNTHVLLQVYDDAPWMGNQPMSSSTNNFVHAHISNSVAAKLGCLSRRRMLLDMGSNAIGLELDGMHAFGQSE